jgi:phosphotriesterase-related protein
MTAIAHTAAGDIPADQLGFTLGHEHLTWASPGWHTDPKGSMPREEMVRSVIEQVQAAKDGGVDTMFDATPAEMGRDVSLAREVSLATGMNIVWCTGLYARWPTPYFYEKPVEEITEIFLHELVNGDEATGTHPGFIKLAVNDVEFSAYERKAMDAVAAAYEKKPTPILVHTEHRVGLPVLQYLVTELGIDGKSVIVGHADLTPDLEYLVRLVDEFDAYLGLDHFGCTFHGTDAMRRALVLAMCHMGYSRRILLSQDTFASISGVPALKWADYPDWKFTHMNQKVIPALLKAHVTTADIETMTRKSPVSWLTGSDS